MVADTVDVSGVGLGGGLCHRIHHSDSPTDLCVGLLVWCSPMKAGILTVEF